MLRWHVAIVWQGLNINLLFGDVLVAGVSATALNKSVMWLITVCCDLMRVGRNEFASLRTACQRGVGWGGGGGMGGEAGLQGSEASHEIKNYVSEGDLGEGGGARRYCF